MLTSSKTVKVTGCLVADPTVIMRPGQATSGSLTLLVCHDGTHGPTTVPPSITRVECRVSGAAAERLVRTCQRGDVVRITGYVTEVPTEADPAVPPILQIFILSLVARAARLAESSRGHPYRSPTPCMHTGAR